MKIKIKLRSPVILLLLSLIVWLSLNIFIIYSTYQAGFKNVYIPAIKEIPQNIIKPSRTNLQIKPEVQNVPAIKLNKARIAFGTVEFLPNTIRIFILSNSSWLRMTSGQTVYENDWVRTSQSSQADLRISSSKNIRIFENSEISLDSSGKNKSSLTIPLITVISGKITSYTPLNVKTPDGAMVFGRKTFNIDKRGEEIRVSSPEGGVEVTSGGKTVYLNKNQGTVIEAGKAPGDPFDLPSAPEKIKLQLH